MPAGDKPPPYRPTRTMKRSASSAKWLKIIFAMWGRHTPYRPAASGISPWNWLHAFALGGEGIEVVPWSLKRERSG